MAPLTLHGSSGRMDVGFSPRRAGFDSLVEHHMNYITRLSHFTFTRKGDSLVVTSERDDDFHEEYAWQDSWDEVEKADVISEIHEKYYLKARRAFES